MQSRRSLLIRAFFLLVSIDVVASLLISSNGLENDTVDTNLHRLLRGDYNAASHVLAAAEKEGAAVRVGEEENILPWYHSSRMLLNPSTTCPWPDDITSLSDVRSGQYGSETGDCFYIYWDPSKCDITNGNNNKCPLYIYVDGTTHAADIDERDSTFMVEMAQRGYVAVTVDYDDSILDYNQGCDGFHRKSKEIFDNALSGSVTHQLCSDENVFGHINHVPVDCTKGLVVNGWSQGAHVASLAGNYATSLVTAGLFWGNGNYNMACTLRWSTCSICIPTNVPCMNSNHISLPKEKRRNINGDQDSFFGACENWWGANNRANVIDQLRDISGYSCEYSRDDCFQSNFNQAGYYVIPGKGHTFMDVHPDSEFMNQSTPWGLSANFDWLAEQGRVPSPSGVCSSNSGTTAGNRCSESSDCECGRRGLHASDNANEDAFLTLATADSDHRGLAKGDSGGGGGGKPNPPSPTPPVTPLLTATSAPPTNAPSSEPCGCLH